MRTAEQHVSDEMDQMQGRLGAHFAQTAKLGESGREALTHNVALALEKVNIGAEQQRRKADLILSNADQAISHDTGELEMELKHSTLDAQSRAKLVQTDVKNSLGVLKTEEGKMQSAWMSDKLKIQRKTSIAAEREHAAAGDASIAAHMTQQQGDTVLRNAAKLEAKVMHSFATLDPKEQLRILNDALLSFKADQHALTNYEQFAAQQAHDKAEGIADAVHHALGGGLERISALDAQRRIHDLSGEAEEHREAIGHVQNDMFKIAY